MADLLAADRAGLAVRLGGGPERDDHLLGRLGLARGDLVDQPDELDPEVVLDR